MIALHLSVHEGVPFLWSEGSRIGDLKELRKAVKNIGAGFKVLNSNTVSRVVWLPVHGDIPVPSSPLIGDSPDARKKLRLAPFSILARPLNIEELLLLTSLVENGGVPGSGVVFGNSFPWINLLLTESVKLAAEGAFLPAVTRCENHWEARWLPVTGEETETRLDILIDGLPAVCRCMNNMTDTPPDESKKSVVTNMLARTMDAIVRHSGERRHISSGYNSLHDAWLGALVSDNAIIDWKNKREIEEFSRFLRDWSRPVDVFTRSQFRFCFRLKEPPDNDSKKDRNGEEWYVEYLVQPKTDQSLYLPVADLWDKKTESAKQLKKYGLVPTEFILTALGQASGLCPAISGSLKRKNPDGFSLDSGGALLFLREYTDVLRSAGFTVLLPSWWIGRGPVRRFGLTAHVTSPRMQGNSGITLDSMVRFDYQASLGGEELSLEELKALARLKAPLVKIRGQWTQIDREQIESAIRFLEKKRDQNLSARDLIGIALGAGREEAGLSIENVKIKGWLNELLDMLKGEKPFEQLRQPDLFRGKLRHYQQRGYSWLAFLRNWRFGACLADDMGLGKTVQALALIQREYEAGERRPVLLVCPTSVVNNWRREAQQFTPELTVMVHHGSDRQKKEAFEKAAAEHDMVISSYSLLQRDIDFLRNVSWAGIMLDEAQNIKNPETKQSKAAKTLSSDYRIALTGTPVENHVGDLWSLMDFLNPGLLGNQHRFKNEFYQPIQIYRDADTAGRLKKMTGPFILRRLKTDKSIISDLPEKVEIKEYCTLTKEQATLYKAVVDDMQEKIEQADGINRRGLVLATLTKLKQVCNHPAQFAGDNSQAENRSGKLQRLKELVTEIRESGERTLLFTQYADMGGIVQRYFQEYFGEEVFFLHGAVARKKRDSMIERFQNDDHSPHMFVLSLKAGGTGLTLTRANHVVHYDRWWNPAVENQATDRAFRIGQTKNVQVRKFIVSGTLEERIDDLIESKTGIAEQVVGAGEQWLTELSNEDFRELIKLGDESMGE